VAVLKGQGVRVSRVSRWDTHHAQPGQGMPLPGATRPGPTPAKEDYYVAQRPALPRLVRARDARVRPRADWPASLPREPFRPPSARGFGQSEGWPSRPPGQSGDRYASPARERRVGHGGDRAASPGSAREEPRVRAEEEPGLMSVVVSSGVRAVAKYVLGQFPEQGPGP
jgi:hypothetical protein